MKYTREREVSLMATRTALTYADYAAMPEDGRRYELRDGELSVTPAPGTRHQDLLRDLLGTLNEHVTQGRLGVVFPAPIDCILSDTTVLQPDIVFIETARNVIITERGIDGVPTVVAEILSPSTAGLDRTVKADLYARHGVPWYWIVDPGSLTIGAFALRGNRSEMAGRLAANGRGPLPPFDDLVMDWSSLSS
jgi:Uma2 family endonuclease